MPAALDFHHRDPRDKSFALSHFNGRREQLEAEASKCVLLCANCHLIRNAVEDASALAGAVVAHRRKTKVRAVAHMGSTCYGCDRVGPPVIFAFHHIDPSDKVFGVSEDGIPRSWPKIVAELEKCVMLCANCHREVHAGVRTIRPTLLGLAEDALPYAA